MHENNVSGSVPEGSGIEVKPLLLGAELAIKALEIAGQEVTQVFATGGVQLPTRRGQRGAFIALPRGMDQSDLRSVANETIAKFFVHYPEADADDLGLLRLEIRSELSHTMRGEQRRMKGIEIPPGANDPAPPEREIPDWAALTDLGVITLKQGEVVVLSAAGYSQEQIAKLLCVTQQAVEGHLTRAQKNLQIFFRSSCKCPSRGNSKL